MLVSNLSSERTNAQVQFDADRLNMKSAELKARDAISNDPIDLSEDRATFNMQPFSYRYVRVE